MPTLNETLHECDTPHRGGFREIVVGLESAGTWVFIPYESSGFSTQNALQAIRRSGTFTVACVFGEGRDRYGAPVLRFRAAPGHRTREAQENIIVIYRVQLAREESKKAEEQEDAEQ